MSPRAPLVPPVPQVPPPHVTKSLSSATSSPSATSSLCHQEPPECHQLLMAPGPHPGEPGGVLVPPSAPLTATRTGPVPVCGSLVSLGSLCVSCCPGAPTGTPLSTETPEFHRPCVPGTPPQDPPSAIRTLEFPSPVLVHRHHGTPTEELVHIHEVYAYS